MFFISSVFVFLAATFGTIPVASAAPLSGSKFHSAAGREHEVTFDSYFRTDEPSPSAFKSMNEAARRAYEEREILPVMDFLFGPLTNRALGNPQRTHQILVDWRNLRVRDGRVELPYRYQGIWIVSKKVSAAGELTFPVPLNTEGVFTENWKRCGDSDPEHQTRSFFWYFWDPERYGCDHEEGRHYTTVRARLGRQTQNQSKTYPEYRKLIENGFRMTLAFGYAKDPSRPNPGSDPDVGAMEYRSFLNGFRRSWGIRLKESPIRQSEYPDSSTSQAIIGSRFEGDIKGVPVTVNIVVAAGIDQMEIFAKSYAHDHDDVFGWFGHSRVGGAFDAQIFRGMLQRNPEYYSLSPSYQVIYWGGCNSYSYYTQPFFELRAQASGGRDPMGTKLLDIIANGLPSYFSLNAQNAQVAADAFLNWENPTTYQEMIRSIENASARMGTIVLAAVLGDEDNEN